MAFPRRGEVDKAAMPRRAGAVPHRRIAAAPRQKLVDHAFFAELALVSEKSGDFVGSADLFRHISVGDCDEDDLAVDKRPIAA